MVRSATTRIRQFIIGVAAVLSLVTSSVAACACSHHRDSMPQAQKSCHGTATSHDHVRKDRPSGPSAGESCVCIQSTSKLSVKTEGFKLKKHPELFSVNPSIKAPRFYSELPVLDDRIISSFREIYFADSSPPRGPPVS